MLGLPIIIIIITIKNECHSSIIVDRLQDCGCYRNVCLLHAVMIISNVHTYLNTLNARDNSLETSLISLHSQPRSKSLDRSLPLSDAEFHLEKRGRDLLKHGL